MTRHIQIYPIRPVVTLILCGPLAYIENIYREDASSVVRCVELISALQPVIAAGDLTVDYDVWDAEPTEKELTDMGRRYGDSHSMMVEPYSFAWDWCSIINNIYRMGSLWTYPKS